MKILVISQYFWPENFRINDLAEELYKRGHEITVLTGVPNYPEGKIFKAFDNKKYFNEFHGIVLFVFLCCRGVIRSCLSFLITNVYVICNLFGSSQLRRKNFDIIFVCQLSPVTVALQELYQNQKSTSGHVGIGFMARLLKAVGVIQNQTVLYGYSV